MSGWLIQVLIAEYLLISAAASYERDWARALYFLSAAGISVAVLWMGKR